MSSVDAIADTAAPTMDPPGWAGVGTCALDAVGTFGPRLLSHHVLMLTTAGQGPVEVDFTTLHCRPGTLLWAYPGQAFRLPAPSLDASFVTFEPRLARQPEPDGLRHWQLEGEDEDAVISDFAQLAVDCARHPPGPLAAALLQHQLAVLQLRIALLAATGTARATTSAARATTSAARAATSAARAAMSAASATTGGGRETTTGAARETTTGEGGPESRTFARFSRLLEDAHHTSRRVEDYAAELGCSVRTLTRACLAVTGRTAKQVVDDRVALQARRLLACTPLSVAEVGRHLGFPEPTNFGRFFHREVGTSPGQFRLEVAANSRVTVPAQRRPSD